jgi:hypothetical protein
MNRVTRYTWMHRFFEISKRVADLQRRNWHHKISNVYEDLP